MVKLVEHGLTRMSSVAIFAEAILVSAGQRQVKGKKQEVGD